MRSSPAVAVTDVSPAQRDAWRHADSTADGYYRAWSITDAAVILWTFLFSGEFCTLYTLHVLRNPLNCSKCTIAQWDG
eukprot:SAG31_NODE_40677_length_279_cov_1.144444_1_plen_77_part_01